MASNPYFFSGSSVPGALGFGLARWGWLGSGRGSFRRPSPNAVKNSIYECGLESRGDAWMQFHSAYYL